MSTSPQSGREPPSLNPPDLYHRSPEYSVLCCKQRSGQSGFAPTLRAGVRTPPASPSGLAFAAKPSESCPCLPPPLPSFHPALAPHLLPPPARVEQARDSAGSGATPRQRPQGGQAPMSVRAPPSSWRSTGSPSARCGAGWKDSSFAPHFSRTRLRQTLLRKVPSPSSLASSPSLHTLDQTSDGIS